MRLYVKQKLLFDASSLIYALKLKRVEILHNNYIQWLTVYETLNALWKNACLLKNININDALTIARVLSEIVKFMKVLDPHIHEEEILKTAQKLKVTVYDASYIVLAKSYNLILVTEDKKLKTKAENIVKTVSLNNIIKTH